MSQLGQSTTINLQIKTNTQIVFGPLFAKVVDASLTDRGVAVAVKSEFEMTLPFFAFSALL